MVEKICKNCKYYILSKSIKKLSLDIDGINSLPIGECHKYPPTLNDNYYVFPCVRENDWCGQWETKEQKDEN